MKSRREYIDALCRELELRKDYLRGETVDTVYFGGGTPSQLEREELERIFDALFACFPIAAASEREVTIEANPDDLSPDYVSRLADLPFNRISIGIQSFHDKDLSFLNRRHRATQAIESVDIVKKAGFDNISIDLMYGLPGQDLPQWEDNLKTALRLDVKHISAYHLTCEEGTRLYRLMQSNQVREGDEELSVELFAEMVRRFTEAGFVHYEISNFALPGYLSRHNSSYWTGSLYLGAGASAHSYNGDTRQWNVCSIPKYIRSVQKGCPAVESERIDNRIAYNDYILTGLRTMWGIDTDKIADRFGLSCKDYCIRRAERYIGSGMLRREGSTLRLSAKGIFVSDGIMSDLMIVP